MLLPVKIDQLVHPHTGDFIETNKHRLAGFPAIRVMLNEIFGNLAQTFPAGDNVIIPFQFAFKRWCTSMSSISSSSSFGGYLLIQVFGSARVLIALVILKHQRFAACIIIKRHGRLIFDRPLKIIGRNVITKHLAGDLVVLEQAACR